MDDRWVWVEHQGEGGQLLTEAAVQIRLQDRGFWYGDGLFESLRVVQGAIPLLERHLERLTRSLATLGFPPLSLSRTEWASRCREVLVTNGIESGFMRIAVSRGMGPRGFLPPAASRWMLLIQAGPYQPDPGLLLRGMTAAVAPWRVDPQNPTLRVKSLSGLDKVLAKQEAARLGVDEMLFLNTDGCLTEGAATNLFILANGAIITPDVGCGLLQGVARGLVMELAQQAGYPVMEGQVSLTDLQHADEAFLTNALQGIIPLISVCGRSIGRKDGPGPETLQLEERYRQALAGLAGH